MAARDTKASKPKRHRKRQSRTQVTSTSDTDSASDSEQKSKSKSSAQAVESSPSPAPAPGKTQSERDLDTRFTNHYLQRATTEFAEDLDKIREADDFGAEALDMLVFALKQGTEMFGVEERRRIVGGGL